MPYTLNDLKPLTIAQADECRARALERVSKRIGDKPSRNQFKRDLGRLWSVLDILALVVFIPALAVSSIHIISHMGHLAEASYLATAQASAGTVISRDLFVAVHQWALIPLAEGSMILFLVMFGQSREGWRRAVYFALALLAGVFVLVANWQSGIGLLESLLAPAFTIGIGLKLEHLIVQSLKRKREIDEKYLAAVAVYESASQDATQHPDYAPLLKQELWQQLIKPKAAAPFVEAPAGFKYLAVKRELDKDGWAHQEQEPVGEFILEEVAKVEGLPFGPPVPGSARDGQKSMRIAERVNGHGGELIEQSNN